MSGYAEKYIRVAEIEMAEHAMTQVSNMRDETAPRPD